MTLDMGNTDKLAGIPQRGAAARHQGASRPRSTAPASISTSPAATHPSMRWPRSRASGGPRWRPSWSARGERAFADLADFARRINPRAVNKRVLESLAAAGAFDDIERDRARAVAAMDAVLATAQRTFEDRCARPERVVRRPGRTREARRCRTSRPGCRRNGCSANTTPSASSCRAIRSTITPGSSRTCGSRPGRNSRAR